MACRVHFVVLLSLTAAALGDCSSLLEGRRLFVQVIIIKKKLVSIKVESIKNGYNVLFTRINFILINYCTKLR